MGTMQWLKHFEASAQRPRNVAWSGGVALDPHVREPVIASLQTFQRGLTSPGINLRTKVHKSCTPEYAQCVDLYVAEKAMHADLLMRLLWDAGSEPSSRQWTDFLFRHLRRRFDWARELVVLLTVEMAAVPFFRILANNVPDPALRRVLEIILEDQAYHLGFHIDHLREAMEGRSGVERLALQQLSAAMFGSTLAIVIADHRALFEALGYDKLKYWTDAWNLFAQVQTGLHGSQHLAAVLGRDPRLKFAL
mgnify:CR=1 FL=1